MRIRDALESDAEALATATDRPRGVVKNMIHDRSVRVAVTGTERTVAMTTSLPSRDLSRSTYEARRFT